MKRFFLQNHPESVISQASAHFETGKTALIAGGGYDNLLPLLLQKNTFRHITFVDISPKMILRMKKRCKKMSLSTENTVTFICRDLIDFSTTPVDAVFLPFFLDIIPDDRLPETMSAIRNLLKPNGHVYLFDFRKVKPARHPLQALKLWLLHLAFLPFARINRTHLPDFDSLFGTVGMGKTNEIGYFNNAYSFSVYRPPQPKSTAARVTSAN